MADSLTLSLLSNVPVPNPVLSTKSQLKCSVLFRQNPCSISSKIGMKCVGYRSSTRLYAGLTDIEPDINEDPVDRWRTNGIDIVIFSFFIPLSFICIVDHENSLIQKSKLILHTIDPCGPA